jgi:hypothetical protein
MSLEKFAPRDIPFQASSSLREYLDNEMSRIQVLLNNAAQLENELIPDSLLSANVALLNANNVFSVQQAIVISGAQPLLLERTGSDINCNVEFKTTSSSVYIGNTDSSFSIGPNLNLLTSPYAVFSADLATINAQEFQAIGTKGGIYTKTLGLGDDATDTYTLPANGAWVFVTDQTTSAGTNDYALIYFFSTTVAIVVASNATTVSIGTGANPDVDGDINIWCGASGIISVKNRRGSFRYVTLTCIAL